MNENEIIDLEQMEEAARIIREQHDDNIKEYGKRVCALNSEIKEKEKELRRIESDILKVKNVGSELLNDAKRESKLIREAASDLLNEIKQSENKLYKDIENAQKEYASTKEKLANYVREAEKKKDEYFFLIQNFKSKKEQQDKQEIELEKKSTELIKLKTFLDEKERKLAIQQDRITNDLLILDDKYTKLEEKHKEFNRKEKEIASVSLEVMDLKQALKKEREILIEEKGVQSEKMKVLEEDIAKKEKWLFAQAKENNFKEREIEIGEERLKNDQEAIKKQLKKIDQLKAEIINKGA